MCQSPRPSSTLAAGPEKPSNASGVAKSRRSSGIAARKLTSNANTSSAGAPRETNITSIDAASSGRSIVPFVLTRAPLTCAPRGRSSKPPSSSEPSGSPSDDAPSMPETLSRLSRSSSDGVDDVVSNEP